MFTKLNNALVCICFLISIQSHAMFRRSAPALIGLTRVWEGIELAPTDSAPHSFYPLTQQDAASISLVELKKDQEEGYSLIFKRKKSAQWRHLILSDPAPQGDPRFPAFALEETIGSFLGFEVHENNVILPDFEKLSARVKFLFANEDVRLQFYRVNGTIDPRAYLQKFYTETALPISSPHFTKGRPPLSLMVHDLVYHVAGFVLMPDECIFLAKQQIRFLFDFETYFRKQNPSIGRIADEVFSSLINEKAEDLDAGTGWLTRDLTSTDKFGTMAHSPINIFNTIAGPGQFVGHPQQPWDHGVEEHSPYLWIQYNLAKILGESPHHLVFESAFENYAKEQADPLFLKGFYGTEHDLVRLIKEKKERLEKVVRSLTRKI